MAFYTINIIIFIIYAFLIRNYRGKSKSSEKKIVILSALHFGIIMALRGISVGTDTLKYSARYLAISQSHSSLTELVAKYGNIGFTILEKTFSYLAPNRNGYMILTAILITSLIWYFIYTNSDDSSFSIYLYIAFSFYFSSLNVSRQYIAIGLSLLMYQLIKNKKWKSSFVVYLLAVSFHSTAAISIFLYFIYFIKWSKKTVIFYIGILTCFLLSYQRIISIFNSIFSQYSSYEVENSQYSGGTGSTTFYIIFVLAALVGFYLIRKHCFEIDNEHNVTTLCVLTITGGLMGLVFSGNFLLARVAQYYTIYSIILVPTVIEGIYPRNTINGIITKSAVYLIMFIPILYWLYNGLSGIVPYVVY